MPRHDWHELSGWEGVRLVWIVDLLRWLQRRLPEGFRAYIGSTPALAIGAPAEHPDLHVRLEHAWGADSDTLVVALPAAGRRQGESR